MRPLVRGFWWETSKRHAVYWRRVVWALGGGLWWEDSARGASGEKPLVGALRWEAAGRGL